MFAALLGVLLTFSASRRPRVTAWGLARSVAHRLPDHSVSVLPQALARGDGSISGETAFARYLSAPAVARRQLRPDRRAARCLVTMTTVSLLHDHRPTRRPSGARCSISEAATA